MKLGIDRAGTLGALLDTLVEEYGDSLPASVKLPANIVRRLISHASGAELKDFRSATKEDIDTVLGQSKRIKGVVQSAQMSIETLGFELRNELQLISNEQANRLTETAQKRSQDAKDTMHLYVERTLRAHKHAKTDEAGYLSENSPSLGPVFTDLQVARTYTHQVAQENEQQLRNGLALTLFQASSRSFRPTVISNIHDGEDTNRANASRKERLQSPGKTLVVGGPGQGKSTITQYICQVHRAKILCESGSALAPATRQAVDQLFSVNSISQELKRSRTPFYVKLSNFAAELEKSDFYSLVNHLTKEISRPEHPFSAVDLRNWMQSEPYIVILDGLDEVPTSANREQIIAAIQDFISEIMHYDADVMVLTTTRPQGYEDELKDSGFESLYLRPLSQARGLRLAKRLTESLYPDNGDIGRQILDRLATGMQNAATARLMQSPLQVTIMTLLVDQIGEPPRERWRLFDEYHRIVLKREVGKKTPISEVLSKYRSDIQAVHNSAAIHLQRASAKAGTTDSRMSVPEFDLILKERLEREGHAADEVERSSKTLCEAALDRLVLLTQVTNETIGFDVRSLQEFFAANFLCELEDAQMRLALKEIAPHPFWRNTFLFAASRIFSIEERRRDMIIGILEELNQHEDGEYAEICLPGSRLAIELIGEGIADGNPQFQRRLTGIALRMLGTSDIEAAQILAEQTAAIVQEELKRELSVEIPRVDPSHYWGGYAALIRLAESGSDWAIRLLNEAWAEDINIQKDVMSLTKPVIDQVSLIDQAVRLRPAYGYNDARHPRTTVSFAQRSEWPNILSQFQSIRSDSDLLKTEFLIDPARYINFRFSTEPISQNLKLDVFPTTDTLLDDNWHPFIAAGYFNHDPCASRLADALDYLAENWKNSYCTPFRHCGWPLAECFLYVGKPESIPKLARAAREGLLGDIDDWRRAEDRWKAEGVGIVDVQSSSPGLPFNSDISSVGFPFLCSGTSVTGTDNKKAFATYIADEFVVSMDPISKARWAELLIDCIETDSRFNLPRQKKFSMNPEVLADCFECLKNRVFRSTIFGSVDLDRSATPDILESLNRIGVESGTHHIGHIERKDFKTDWADLVFESLSNTLEQPGLLRLASTLRLCGASMMNEYFNISKLYLTPGDSASEVHAATLALLNLNLSKRNIQRILRERFQDSGMHNMLRLVCESAEESCRKRAVHMAAFALQEFELDLRNAVAIRACLTKAVDRERKLADV